MKNLVLVLFVTLSSVVFSQPNYDSLNKLPFNSVTCPTTKEDLYGLDVVYSFESLEGLSDILSLRYGYYVECDRFVDVNGFTDVVIYLRLLKSEDYKCCIMTLLSITENLCKRGILHENIDLYYKIYTTTSEN